MFDCIWSTILLGSFICVVWFWSRRQSHLPPGPRLWIPLFGHIFSLGPDIKQTFRRWREDHGDVFSLYIGTRLVVVLNGFSVIKDALVNNGGVFDSRPVVFVSEFTSKGKGISSTSGDIHAQQKDIAHRCLHGFGLDSGENILEIKILEEVSHLIKLIGDERGKRFNPSHFIDRSLVNVMFSIVLGKRYEHEDPMFVEYMKRSRETFDAAGLLNFIPSLQYMPFDMFNIHRLRENVTFVEEEIIRPAIEQHKNDPDTKSVTNFISVYLKEMKTENASERWINESNMTKSARDLIIAGSDITSATLQWCILHLMKHQEIQEKCYQEIKENIGSEKSPSMSEKHKLPYVQAVITEVQRVANVCPLGRWHSTSTDVVFRGHNIPKGTVVFPVLDSVLMDPSIWENPEEFRPERHVNADGELCRKEEWIPFSIGNRSCLDEFVANMELFLFISGLIQQYRFQSPPEANGQSLEPVSGHISFPKCFKVQALQRHCL